MKLNTINVGQWRGVVRGMVLLAFGVAAAGGCRGSSLWNVTNPVNEIAESALNSPTGAAQAFVGAKGQFISAVFGAPQSPSGGVVLYASLLSDELTQSYTNYFTSVDARYTSAAEPNVGDQEGRGDIALSNLVQARSALLLPVSYLVNNEIGVNRGMAGESEALAGYAELLMAEDYCAGVPLSQAVAGGGIIFGQPLTTDSLFGVAEAHFKAALSASYGDTTVAELASVGLGRTLLGRGRFDSAATAVATVPTGFVYDIYGSGGSSQYAGQLYWNGQYSCPQCPWAGPVIANNEGNTANNFVASNDARLAVVPLGYTVDGSQNTQTAGLHLPDSLFYWPVKFGSTPAAFVAFPLATGIEARLIQAEDTLQKIPGDLVPYLDSLRTRAPSTYINATNGVGALAGDSTTCGGAEDTACVKTFFRERAFWLFATGTRLGDMRREERQYLLRDSSVYPHGAYWSDPTDSATLANAYGQSLQPPWSVYGTDVSLTVPTSAATTPNDQYDFSINPYFKGGCLAGTTTQTP